MSRKRSLSALAVLSLTLSACNSFTLPASAPDGDTPLMEAAARVSVSRIDITPTSTLLTAVGATATLQATVYDMQGRKVTTSVKWVSSNPTAVTIDPKGKVTAKVAVGFTQITAEAGGVKSKPVLITVAKLNPNAVVVSDAQIASSAVPLMPAPSGSLTGARFQVALSGVHPKPGQVLLSSGTSPINGRVLSSTPSGGQTIVTLETVPLEDVYQDLSVSQRVALTSSDVIALTGAHAPENVERHADGSLTVSYRLPKNVSRRSIVQAQGWPDDGTLPGPFKKVEWEIGKFKCSSTLDVLLSGDLLSLKIENKLDVDFTAHITNRQLTTLSAVASGELNATITGGIDVDLGAQGELKCKAIFAEVPVPISGPLATFIAPTVPIGVSFGLEGKLKLGKAQLVVEGKVSSKKKVGFAYDVATDTVTSINEGSTTTTLTPKFKMVNPVEDFRFEGSLAVQGLVGLNVRTFPWLGSAGPAIEALELTFGPKVEGSFAPESTQARVNDYASSYAYKMVAALGPGSTLQDLAGIVSTRGQWKIGNFGVQGEVTISRSPNGTLSGPSNAKAGQPTIVIVDLNPANIQFIDGWYSPSEVRLYRDRGGVLEFVGAVTPSAWQTHFEFPWTPSPLDVGQTVVLRAFVSSGLLNVPLELDDDAKISVAVSKADSDVPPPSSPPASGSGWYGTVTYRWSGDKTFETTTPSGVTEITRYVQNGTFTCNYNATDSVTWSYSDDYTEEWRTASNDSRREYRKVVRANTTQAFDVGADLWGVPDVYYLASVPGAVRITDRAYFNGELVSSREEVSDQMVPEYGCTQGGIYGDTNPDPNVITLSKSIFPLHAGIVPEDGSFKETMEVNLTKK
ncbi:Ig-like domain-containing protein [Deinococcus yavapaiensis]|uniref:Ig-like protein group 2 n=1 Tax=Deinococcus yavapaiensis KR-236 TaxID=694435 RepID=A0A318S3L6_9DEIO|nr:Ig-like domain-containing protein [Deinococcus yavapaiensis]PYE50959.1 Ig-like protein group 2 [Deinococcus yavapaiensis KR-236]